MWSIWIFFFTSSSCLSLFIYLYSLSWCCLTSLLDTLSRRSRLVILYKMITESFWCLSDTLPKCRTGSCWTFLFTLRSIYMLDRQPGKVEFSTSRSNFFSNQDLNVILNLFFPTGNWFLRFFFFFFCLLDFNITSSLTDRDQVWEMTHTHISCLFNE